MTPGGAFGRGCKSRHVNNYTRRQLDPQTQVLGNCANKISNLVTHIVVSLAIMRARVKGLVDNNGLPNIPEKRLEQHGLGRFLHRVRILRMINYRC